MPLFWFVILGAFLGIFFLFEGYEWGARIAYGLFTSNDDERRQVLKSVQSVWSANEIWFLAFLGLTYWVFPEFFKWIWHYFSGILYVIIFLYVLSIVLNNLIRVFWDKPFRRILDFFFVLTHILMVILFGLMIAVFLRGWEGDQLRWTSVRFSPFSEQSGYLDWFTVLFILFFYILVLLEGLGWLVHKVKPAFARKLKFQIRNLAVAGLIVFLIFIVFLYLLHKDSFHYFFVYPVWIIVPILIISAFGGLMAIRTYAKNNKGYFLATNLFIYFWLGIMILKYPYLVRPGRQFAGIDIYHTEFHDLTTYNGHWWVIAVTAVLLVYSVLIHKYSKGKSLREEA